MNLATNKNALYITLVVQNVTYFMNYVKVVVLVTFTKLVFIKLAYAHKVTLCIVYMYFFRKLIASKNIQ